MCGTPACAACCKGWQHVVQQVLTCFVPGDFLQSGTQSAGACRPLLFLPFPPSMVSAGWTVCGVVALLELAQAALQSSRMGSSPAALPICRN